MHLPLIDFHGNSGSPDFAPASPRYTECRLTPLGAGVLAAERGAIGPLPIGLINGSTHAGGVRPPLDPINVVRAIRLASTATDEEVVELVGLPAFSTGCNVDGDLEPFAAGEVTELHLSARVSEAGPFRIVISNLPPGSAVGEIANRIAARVHPERPVPNDPGLATTSVVRPDEPSPITDVNDRTTTPGATNLVVSVAPHSNVSAAIAVLDGIWGIERSLTVQLERPLATAIRAFAASADADANLERRLTAHPAPWKIVCASSGR